MGAEVMDVENRCGACRHFYQHYVLDAQSCVKVCCGHCAYPRLKSRKPDTPACRNFAPGERELPESRYFLTRELLRWIESLEMPPEIRDEESV